MATSVRIVCFSSDTTVKLQFKFPRHPTAQNTQMIITVILPLLELCCGIMRHYGYSLKSAGCYGASEKAHSVQTLIKHSVGPSHPNE